MNYLRQPSLGDKCDSCSCKFDVHYATFDGKQMGCTSQSSAPQYERCSCKGFAFIYKPMVQWTQSSHQKHVEDYYNK